MPEMRFPGFWRCKILNIFRGCAPELPYGAYSTPRSPSRNTRTSNFVACVGCVWKGQNFNTGSRFWIFLDLPMKSDPKCPKSYTKWHNGHLNTGFRSLVVSLFWYYCMTTTPKYPNMTLETHSYMVFISLEEFLDRYYWKIAFFSSGFIILILLYDYDTKVS